MSGSIAATTANRAWRCRMRCLECGTERTKAAQACAQCGTPVARQESAGTQSAGGEVGDRIAPALGNGPNQPTGQRPEPNDRRNALVLAGLGLVLLVAVSVLVWSVITIIGRLSSSTPRASSASSAPPASASAPPGRQLTEDQLRPGDCLNGSDLSLDNNFTPWPEFFTVVPCTQRHVAEVYFARNIWRQSRAYPGDDQAYNQAAYRCADALSAYVAGSTHNTAAFAFTEIMPDGTTWPTGDRLVVCVTYEVTDQYPGGAPVDYSIKGSKR